MSFGSVFGAIVQGVGSVLSIIPGVGPLIGAPVVALGGAISSNATSDAVSAAAMQVAATQRAAAAAKAATASSLTTSSVWAWIQDNTTIVLIALAAFVVFIIKPFRRKR